MAKMHNTQGIAKTRYLEPDRVVNAMQWMEAVLGKSYGVTDDDIKDENFEKFLGRPKIGSGPDEIIGIRDGVDLCNLVIKLNSNIKGKVMTMKNPAMYRNNVQAFLDALTKKFQIPPQDLMDTQYVVLYL